MAVYRAAAINTTVDEFADLVRGHQAMVFSIAYHFLHDAALAEEVAQDVFLQLHREMRRIESAEHAVNWLRRVTVHRSIDAARTRQRHAEVPLEDVPEPAARENTGDPLLRTRLRQLVATLPEKMRMVIVLRYTEDLGPEEIAQLLSMPVATVKSDLQRGLAMLGDKIRRTLGDVDL